MERDLLISLVSAAQRGKSDAMDKLFTNLNTYKIPLNMLHQYMPLTYAKVRDGELPLDAKELAMDGVTNFMLDYEYAVTL